MLPPAIADWYAKQVVHFERTYLAHSEPWAQSGYFGDQESWNALRRPIAECVDGDGAFLDIGCANGYLLECLLEWTAEKGIEIEPWGLDLSPRLIELAWQRLPAHRHRIQVGNAFSHRPVRRFRYVRTGLYAPRPFLTRYLRRLLSEALEPEGKLLVVQYRSDEPGPELTIDQDVRALGLEVDDVVSAVGADGAEGVRIAVVRQQ